MKHQHYKVISGLRDCTKTPAMSRRFTSNHKMANFYEAAVQLFHAVKSTLSKNKRSMILISIIGCVTQVIQQSEQYFRYSTTTDVIFEHPRYLELHKIGLCIRFSDILDTEKLLNETGIRFDPIETLEDAMERSDLLTIKQIFEYTPNEHSFMRDCMFRREEWSFQQGNYSTCYKEFIISKFMTLEFMCYKIQRILDPNFTMTTLAVTRSLFHTNYVFMIGVSSLFQKANLVIPMMWREGDLPHLARDHTEHLPYLKSISLQTLYNTLLITPTDTEIKRLKRPYDTQCTDGTLSSMFTCETDCLQEGLLEFNLAPSFQLLSQPLDLKPVSYHLMQNKTFADSLDSLYKVCNKRCLFIPCHEFITQTSVRLSLEICPHFNAGVCKGLNIYSIISKDALTKTEAKPSMSFVDYFSFITSCFGTWFGVSFISFDPKILMHEYKRFRRRRRRQTATIRRSRIVPFAQTR